MSQPTVRNVIQVARKREVARRAVAFGGIGLAVGSGAGCLVILAGRLLPVLWAPAAELGNVPWWGVAGAGAGAGVVAGVLAALARPWSDLHAARELDARLGLKDRLSTALEGVKESEFGPLIDADAAQAAATADLARAIDVRREWRGAAWSVAPVLLAACVGVGLWMPALKAVPRIKPQLPVTQATRDAGANLVQLAKDAAGRSADAATPQRRASLEALERELAKGELDDKTARAMVANEVTKTASELARGAEESLRQTDDVRRRLADAAGGRETSGVGEKLKRGDLAGAAEALQKAAGELAKMSPDEKSRLASDLKAMEQSLEQQGAAPGVANIAPSDPQNPAATGDAAAEHPTHDAANPAHGDATPPPTDAKKLADAVRRARESLEQRPRSSPSTTPGEPAKPEAASKDAGTPSQSPPGAHPKGDESKQDASKQPLTQSTPGDQPPANTGTQSQPRERQDGQGKSDTNADKPEREKPETPADQTSPESKTPQQGEKPDGQKGQSHTGEGARKPDAPGAAKPDRVKQPGEKPPPTGQKSEQESEESTQGGATQGERKQGGATHEGSERDGAKPGEPREQSRPGETGEQQPQGQPDKGQQRQDAQPGSQQPPSTQPGAAPQPASQGEQPHGSPPSGSQSSQHRPGTQPRGDQPGESPDQSPSQALQDLAGQLSSQARKRDDATRSARDAQKLERQAQDILRGMTPEQREQLGQLANESAMQQEKQPGDAPPQGGTPPPSDPSQMRTGHGKGEGGDGSGPRGPILDQPSQADVGDQNSRGPIVRPRGDLSAGERPVAPWMGDNRGTPGRNIAGSSTTQTVREAAAGVERAIEQQAVPPAYADVVRRVFRRYVERASPMPAQDAPTPAKDAPRPGGS